MKIISASEVEQIHYCIANKFRESEDTISPVGVKNREMLESAAARAFQTVDKKPAYAAVHERAAVLFHGIINNHPFHNGNKRTALIAAQVLLARKNYWLNNTDDNELFEFTRKVAAHSLSDTRSEEIADIAEWFEAKTRRIKKGEHPLTYRALKDILARFDYSIDPPQGDLLGIYNKAGRQAARVIKGGVQGFPPYDVDYINRLRKKLKLDSKNGCDSIEFYGEKGTNEVAAELVDMRIEVMRRLAKT